MPKMSRKTFLRRLREQVDELKVDVAKMTVGEFIHLIAQMVVMEETKPQ